MGMGADRGMEEGGRGHPGRGPAPGEPFGLRATGEPPPGRVRTEPVREETGREAPVLACAGCRRPITSRAAGIEVDGGHEHTFLNPAGIRFRIGCFARAACVPSGEPSTYWTWFPAYSWQIGLCPGCGEHLGWLFRSADHQFYGLILDRLVEVEP